MKKFERSRLHLPVALAIGLVCALELMAQTSGAGGTEEERLSMLRLILKGGPIMIPLGIGSVLAVAIAAERFLNLRHDKVIPPAFVEGLQSAMSRDAEGIDNSLAYCKSVGGPLGDIFRAGMLRLSKDEDAVEKAIEDTAYREVDKLKRSLRGLAIIASVSPLLGLLGTVYGMISAFQDATIAGMGKADMLAEGIYEALVTTAAGLTIAIPVLLVYQFLTTRVDSLVDEIDELCVDFMSSCLTGNVN